MIIEIVQFYSAPVLESDFLTRIEELGLKKLLVNYSVHSIDVSGLFVVGYLISRAH